MALHRARGRFEIDTLITMFSEDGLRSRSHGLRPEVIEAQAEALGASLVAGRASWDTYEEVFSRLLRQVLARGINHVIFGDIYLEAAREWAGRMCEDAGLAWSEPLWGSDTTTLFREFVSMDTEALIVSCNSEKLDRDWLGRPLHADMLPEFKRLGIDPCGENGEFHTVVTRAPGFERSLPLRRGEVVQRDGCWAVDLLPGAN